MSYGMEMQEIRVEGKNTESQEECTYKIKRMLISGQYIFIYS